ncbi:MAG TPA: hypothetical protein VKB93_07170 [Thermoanaerobaculia bacterium]|nr:hypothetical protein [Thermoanaerobaculia bacterium]
MSISFRTEVVTITEGGPDKMHIKIPRQSVGVIIWTGDDFQIRDLQIQDDWPFDKPQKLKGADNTFYVTYRNNNPQGTTIKYGFTYSKFSGAVPPEIENQGSP